ncbi:MAG: ribosomal protein S18-alanine N-acetyltransferase [Acutalibacteraceae bacterium]|nr:ribosomal protein S18-alanine N-acetyltransferase [Acutalibacteraceae bacterium]
MMDLEIKKMTASHIEEIAKLEKECFSSPWSEDGLKSELDNNFARFFVAFSGETIAGYIGSHNVLGEVYITNVAVFPEFRRNGVGKALVELLANEMKAENADFVTLEVRKSNQNAISLYEKCGFQKVGERRNFYEKPIEDAILMTYFIN